MAIDEAQARELVAGRLGDGPWRCRAFGAGKFSETFDVAGDTGRYVLRVAPPDTLLQLFYERRMMRQEPALHERLRAKPLAIVALRNS